MPLVTSTEMFKKAYDGGYAVGAFNVNNMEIVQGKLPHQRRCGVVAFDGEQLGSGRAKRANLFAQKRAVLYVAQQKRSVRAEDERAFISVIKQAACAAAQRFRHVDALGRGVHQMFALTVSAI